jgi:hypothetical protein
MRAIRLTCFLLTLFYGSFAQKAFTSADVFTEKTVVWYGLDFTHMKFIGQPDIHGNFYKAPDYVVKYYFRDWNLIPIKEAAKYDIKESFEKEFVYYDVDTLLYRNSKYNPDSLISFSNAYAINPAIIPELVKSYSGVAKEGIGVVYIVESFNSIDQLATYYCVVFDIASKKIFMQEKLTGRPQGGSVKTYWAGAFRDALGNNKKIYKKWKKNAGMK